MSTKPATSKSCNTQSCEEAPACGCSGWYPGEQTHGWYYEYLSEDDSYVQSGHYLTYLVFNGARISSGGSRKLLAATDVYCNNVQQSTWNGVASTCNQCNASIAPIVYGAYKYTAYGCCGCFWNNGVSWNQYGLMNVKRSPV